MSALGIDFDGTICDVINDKPISGSFEGVKQMIERKFGIDLYIVIDPTEWRVEKSRWDWLRHQTFYSTTGISGTRIYTRYTQAQVAERRALTTYVSHRPQVIQALVGIVPNLYWFKPRDKDLEAFPNLRQPFVTICYGWPHVVDAILADWNDYHEGAFTTEIIGKSPYGIVCRDETLISAAVKAYQFALGVRLDDEDKLHLPDRWRIADYSTERNVLRVKVREVN